VYPARQNNLWRHGEILSRMTWQRRQVEEVYCQSYFQQVTWPHSIPDHLGQVSQTWIPLNILDYVIPRVYLCIFVLSEFQPCQGSAVNFTDIFFCPCARFVTFTPADFSDCPISLALPVYFFDFDSFIGHSVTTLLGQWQHNESALLLTRGFPSRLGMRSGTI
jgi:hypothetical protein